VVIIVVSFLIHDTLFTGVELLRNDISLTLLLKDLLTRSLPRAVYTIVIIFFIYLWDTSIKPNLKR
jgi:hypothetical protein